MTFSAPKPEEFHNAKLEASRFKPLYDAISACPKGMVIDVTDLDGEKAPRVMKMATHWALRYGARIKCQQINGGLGIRIKKLASPKPTLLESRVSPESAARIVRAVELACLHYAVVPDDLLTSTKIRAVCDARALVYWLTKQLGIPYLHTAAKLNVSHAAVLNGAARMQDLIDTTPRLAKAATGFLEKLRADQ